MVRMVYDGGMARPLTKPKRYELRLSDGDIAIFEALEQRLGIDRAAVIRLAIRNLARAHRMNLEKLDPPTATESTPQPPTEQGGG